MAVRVRVERCIDEEVDIAWEGGLKTYESAKVLQFHT